MTPHHPTSTWPTIGSGRETALTPRAAARRAARAPALIVLAASLALTAAPARAGAAEPGDAAKGADAMASLRRVLVTGTSRGLGLEFTRQLLRRGDRVFALARNPGESKELAALAKENPERLTLVEGDVADDASIEAARARVAAKTDGLDLLVNNAGIYGARGGGLKDVDFAEVRSVYEVNAIGPLRVTRAFLPLLRKGRPAKVVSITSLMGSVEDNRSGGSWGYRMSKAALNMANRNLSIELRGDGIPCVVIHPGWVRTDMGGPGAPLAPEESVGAIIRTIDAVTLEESGSFLDREGKRVPW